MMFPGITFTRLYRLLVSNFLLYKVSEGGEPAAVLVSYLGVACVFQRRNSLRNKMLDVLPLLCVGCCLTYVPRHTESIHTAIDLFYFVV